MPINRGFKQIDVFTNTAYLGNPVAVVMDGAGLSDAEMQQFAAWTNLSETTFLLPPSNKDADYYVRIFTTTQELPFAGHPTLGSCHAWLEAGGIPKNQDCIVQECKAGNIKIIRDQNTLAFAAPKLQKSGNVEQELLEKITHGLGLTASDVISNSWLVNGPQWIGLHLKSADTVLALTPSFTHLKGLDIGVVGAYPKGQEHDFEVRAFAFSDGPVEDPVTGSLNAGLGQWLIGSGFAPKKYVASQGTVLGRAGSVHVFQDDAAQVWVGGETITCIDGAVYI